MQAADFYEYWEGIQEGWDGPALLVFSDGKKVGARLDRNGLRPARFWQTKDDLIYVASEVCDTLRATGGAQAGLQTGAGDVSKQGRVPLPRGGACPCSRVVACSAKRLMKPSGLDWLTNSCVQE